MKVPVSPYEKIEGIVYIRRMLDKARLFERGELREDLHANLGIAMDAWACEFLGVNYADLAARVKQGADDAAVLNWCFSHGRKPGAQEVKVWNAYMIKYGWCDEASERLTSRKEASGLADRDDIFTMFDYIDADEGRPLHPR